MLPVCSSLFVSCTYLSLQNRPGYEPWGSTVSASLAPALNPSSPNTWRLCFYFKCRYGDQIWVLVKQVHLKLLELSPRPTVFETLSGPLWPWMFNLKHPCSLLSHHEYGARPTASLATNSLWPHYFHKCIIQLYCFTHTTNMSEVFITSR